MLGSGSGVLPTYHTPYLCIYPTSLIAILVGGFLQVPCVADARKARVLWYPGRVEKWVVLLLKSLFFWDLLFIDFLLISPPFLAPFWVFFHDFRMTFSSMVFNRFLMWILINFRCFFGVANHGFEQTVQL